MSGGEDKDEKPTKKSKLPIIVLIIIVLLGSGIAGFFLLKPNKEEEQLIDETLFYKQALLDTYIVNLMTNKNFLKVTVYIEYNPFALERWKSEKAQNTGGGHGGGKADPFSLPEELAEKKIALSDAVIKVISSKTANELLTPEGKEILKDQLVSALNDALGAHEQIIVNVKFSEFIIQ